MKFDKKLIILLSTLSIVFIFFYFFLFFQKGIELEGSFLKLNKTDDMYEYNGTAYGEKLKVIVSGDVNKSNSVTVSYSLGEKLNRTYIVNILSNTISSSDINVYYNNIVKFEGAYKPTNGFSQHNKVFTPTIDSFFDLWDKNGKPFVEEGKIIMYDNHSPFDDSYNVSIHHVVTTAFRDNVITRGSWPFLILAMLLLLITAIDIKWPLFIFTLNNFLSVKNPEPSDFYISMQKISWVVFPVISLFMLLASLSQH